MKNKKYSMTVIMPTFNVDKFIARAIESMLSQTFKDFELIIIDDASTDGTLEIARSYAKKDSRIKIVVNEKNLQVATTLNKGIKIAKSQIIARMDPDDISFPERLEKQFTFMKKHPNIAIVGTNILIINELGELISKREYPDKSNKLKKLMFKYSPFAHPTVMFRKKIFQEFGGYSVSMVPCEDIDLWFKIGSKYEISNIQEYLLKYTLIKTSNSHNDLRYLELLGFKIKIDAIRRYGYRPSAYDVAYNLLEFLTLWLMPASFRIWMYDFLRSHKII